MLNPSKSRANGGRSSTIGLLGEYKVLEFLTRNSIANVHADTGPADIVCFSDQERPIRVQVKTKPHWPQGRTGSFTITQGSAKKRRYHKNAFEVLALVVLDIDDVFFLNENAVQILLGSTMNISRRALTQFTKYQTHVAGWNRAVKGIYPSYEIETADKFVSCTPEEKDKQLGEYKYYLDKSGLDSSYIKQDSCVPEDLLLKSQKEKEKARLAQKRRYGQAYYKKNKERILLAHQRWLARDNNKQKEKDKKNKKYAEHKQLREGIKNESRIRRLYGNRLDSSERSESELQQGILI
tara:strand:+ start:50 stop:934 length:885 start_codon:yes stop_codon:yes gene_type:complete